MGIGAAEEKRELGWGIEKDRQAEKHAGKERNRWREKNSMGTGQGPFKREHSKCAQQVLLLAAAEDGSIQDPSIRPVEMPEY